MSLVVESYPFEEEEEKKRATIWKIEKIIRRPKYCYSQIHWLLLIRII
jgi:hypothetical protein